MNQRLSLFQPLAESPFFRQLIETVQGGTGESCVTGLVQGARSLTLALLARRSGRKLLIVVPDDAAVEDYRRDISAMAQVLGGESASIVVFPALDSDPYDDIAPHPEVVRERVIALGRLQHGDAQMLIVPARALLHWLPSSEEWSTWVRELRVGETLPPDRFVLAAMGQGYRRVETVNTPGEVSRRGGIIDIFPPNLQEPVRIELFADSVESLRSFDTDHQRSTGKLDSVTVGPAMENPPNDEAIKRLSEYLESGRQAAGDDDRAVRQFRKRLDQLQEQGHWPGMQSLAKLTVRRPVLLFEHARDFALIVDEPERTDHELIQASSDGIRSCEASGDRVLPPPDRLFVDPLVIRRELQQARVVLQELAGEEPASSTRCLHVASRACRNYAGRVGDLTADLERARRKKQRTICVMRASGGAERLIEILNEYGLPVSELGSFPDSAAVSEGGIFVGVAPLRSGFEFHELGLTVLCEREIFGEKRKSTGRKSATHAAFIADFRDLKRGDIVVHVDHGVAAYDGLGRPKGGSLNRDFMVLQFCGGDKLFVPVDRLDLVQRYSGVGGAKPALDRLGGPGWERVKSRVRKSVRSMAKELLELYARRAAASGNQFSPDSAWQQDLEAAFPFDLTPDQQRSITEIKAEMESPRAMDRLLVGDVGFGKTEIGVRAAFKAVMDGFQVALLTPTTVLALQHFETVRERFAPYPVRVEMVSRFRTAAETRKTLEDVKLGSVDVLIGTHRMLSKDVEFRNLGLLLVDEEQRFGVAHKERLKQMTVGVDVLSMTATPIPRTLQMSLAGVRDLSVIETPPPGRMAIQTYLIPFRKNVLAQAIRQELRRGGQVFVVHNRIETLPAITRAIQEMVPDARVVAAHGQMPERHLESVMLQFVRHEADVLVTTTIIENGLDIPRANTIIVNRADRLGLAQLYQLRGRVGRSHQHAYAYFVVPSPQHLTDIARKRLKALQEFSELGAGFRLAAADLEIRGAGELLGSRQHGHIAALGFDMYCQMLERAVQEMKGQALPERRPPTLHLGVDIKLPGNYLPDSGDRLALYKRLAQARTIHEVEDLRTETEDRFGHLPPAAGNLFNMARLRAVAEDTGVKSVDLAEGKLQIRFHERPSIEPEKVIEMLARESGSLTPSGMMMLPAPPRGKDRIGAVIELLHKIADRSAA